MEFTDPGACRFYRNENGFLALELNGKNYRRVQLCRALPFTAPSQYLSVTDMDDKEIASLESLATLESAQQALLQAELDLRYFYPEVTQIKSIKEKMGSYYMELCVGAREKTVAVKDVSKNLKQLEGGELIVTDVDGNRFRIPNVYAIHKKSLRMLEPYLY
jgi:hypothetical protein